MNFPPTATKEPSFIDYSLKSIRIGNMTTGAIILGMVTMQFGGLSAQFIVSLALSESASFMLTDCRLCEWTILCPSYF